ncbi:MAG: hypothetical protein LBE08_01095, partial [Bifidobacteriaceae bacterium]|nr:hypothetical protein [Bifidobacteriaceae bacterium]
LGLDASARADYAGLLEHAAGVGNIRSGTRGGLPEGYVPLTGSQAEATKALALRLVASADEEAPPSAPPSSIAPSSNGSYPAQGNNSGGATSPTSQATDPGGVAQMTTTEAALAGMTPASLAPGQKALGASLGLGLAGMVAAPFLLRRRSVAP